MIGRLPPGLVAAGLLTAISASPATAHVELLFSSPAAGVNLSTAPTVVTVTFDDELDPDLSRFTVSGPGSVAVGNGAVDLTVADRNVLTGDVVITQPGIYTVSYDVAGVDGHELEGAFSFGYQATSKIPDPIGDEAADTAMRPPGQRPLLSLLGVAFLGASALIIRRRMGAR